MSAEGFLQTENPLISCLSLSAMGRPSREQKLDVILPLGKTHPEPEAVGPFFGCAEDSPVACLVIDLHWGEVLGCLIDDSGLAKLSSHDRIVDPSASGRVEQRDH